jgi:hypothetical protein
MMWACLRPQPCDAARTHTRTHARTHAHTLTRVSARNSTLFTPPLLPSTCSRRVSTPVQGCPPSDMHSSSPSTTGSCNAWMAPPSVSFRTGVTSSAVSPPPSSMNGEGSVNQPAGDGKSHSATIALHQQHTHTQTHTPSRTHARTHHAGPTGLCVGPWCPVPGVRRVESVGPARVHTCAP